MTIGEKLVYMKYILLLFFFSIAGFLNHTIQQPLIIVKKQSSAINIENSILQFFSIGQKRLLSSLLWVTTLLEADLEHYNEKDLNSWLFLRFNSIINLDPYFLGAYHFGGQYLTIVKNDLIGADSIYDRGLKLFPNDYKLLFDSGFLYAYELQDQQKAIHSYTELLKHKNAPPFVKTILAKLKFELSADLEETYILLLDMYKNEPEKTILKTKLEKDLYAIKAELDLKCLNSTDIAKCNKIDFEGNKYIYLNSKYRAPRDFKPYKILIR